MIDRLTPHQRAILRCVCAGSGNKEVAAQLGVATDTIKNQLTTIYAKLGLGGHGSRAAIVACRMLWDDEHETGG